MLSISGLSRSARLVGGVTTRSLFQIFQYQESKQNFSQLVKIYSFMIMIQSLAHSKSYIAQSISIKNNIVCQYKQKRNASSLNKWKDFLPAKNASFGVCAAILVKLMITLRTCMISFLSIFRNNCFRLISSLKKEQYQRFKRSATTECTMMILKYKITCPDKAKMNQSKMETYLLQIRQIKIRALQKH